jgi:preprotein translocase subunit SecB
MSKKSSRHPAKRLTAKSGKLEFRGLRLIESSSKLGNMKKDGLPDHANQSININLIIPDGSKDVASNLKIRLTCTYHGEEEKDPAISVFASFLVNYEVLEAFKQQEKLSELLKRMAILNVWPYWREFVQTMTSRMGLPPFPVPLIYTDDLKKEKAQKDN